MILNDMLVKDNVKLEQPQNDKRLLTAIGGVEVVVVVVLVVLVDVLDVDDVVVVVVELV